MVSKFQVLRKATYLLFFLILFSYAVIIARDFLYPISLAVLFAYLLYPIGHFLESKGVPRLVANTLCVVLLFALIAFLFYFISQQVGRLTGNWEEMKGHALDNLNRLEESMSGPLRELLAPGPDNLSDVVIANLEAGGNTLKTLFTATTGTIAKVGLLPVYIFMLLYYRTKLYNFTIEITPDKYHERTRNIILRISYVMRNYIGGVFVVVLILCVVNSVGLAIIGLKYAIFFGVISAIMNFIPYFGTLLGGGIALLAALLLHSDPGIVIGVAIFFIVIQFVENNILTPNITGGYVEINPLFTIFGIVLGGLFWGVPGMFVVVPFLAVLKIIFDHTTIMKPMGKLMGKEGTDKHALNLDKIKRLFSRD